jgi:TolA-binding protein
MVALVALIAVVVILAWVVPAIASSVARSVVSSLDRSPSSGSIDQSVVEARLTRIEQAIDAMATEIERLSDYQRALLGPAPDSGKLSDADRTRTESPR